MDAAPELDYGDDEGLDNVTKKFYFDFLSIHNFSAPSDVKADRKVIIPLNESKTSELTVWEFFNSLITADKIFQIADGERQRNHRGWPRSRAIGRAAEKPTQSCM